MDNYPKKQLYNKPKNILLCEFKNYKQIEHLMFSWL